MRTHRGSEVLLVGAVLAVVSASVSESGRPRAEDRPASITTAAASEPVCARIEDDAERLDCYDARSRAAIEPDDSSFLERHWDLANEGKRLRPWAHRPNYALLGRWTTDVNEEPFLEQEEGPVDLQAVETKFQISFKTKLVEGLFGGPGNLWFGYTQQSHFQVYNAAESRPFRETDFEPELIAVFPARLRWGSWTWRMVGAGLVHQSNGRSEPLSRSWDRLYVIAAVERGNLSFHFRPWLRIDSTETEDDDNPKIDEFVGRMGAIAVWTPGRHALSVRLRSNLDLHGHKGSLQVDWYVPIGERLRGQIQLFTGYGESLIDYDHRQSAVGLGILLFDPF